MDTELLRTFLEINRTRHFGRAAANLYLTQSAVSARMRLLEESIGLPLLTRNRNDIQLTPAGRKLLPHAEALVERWSQARHEVALNELERSGLHLGARITVAEMVFPAWTNTLWQQHPDLALNIEVLPDDLLSTRLAERTVDVAVTYGMTADPNFKDVQIGQLKLRMMSTDPNQDIVQSLGTNYIYLEWGTWFDVAHAKSFPEKNPGGLRTSSLHLVLELLSRQDGACYLPDELPEITERIALFPVADAPEFEHPIFASYPSDAAQRGVIEEALNTLRLAGVIN